jgi:hypothetical protein
MEMEMKMKLICTVSLDFVIYMQYAPVDTINQDKERSKPKRQHNGVRDAKVPKRQHNGVRDAKVLVGYGGRGG